MGNSKPLAGYKVIDFSAVYAGPICARFLADCGAEVIKIEPLGIGDITRGVDGLTPVFAHFNAGKRSVAVDLKSTRGQNLVRQLVAQVDILVQNFRPGVMEKFGLDYDSLKQEQPELVFCSISGFGLKGPWVNRAAFAPIVHAASGFDSVFARAQNGPDKRPPNWEIMVADILTGAYAFGAIQTALLARQRIGQGEHIDVSMMDAMMTLIPAQLQRAQTNQPVPIGRFHPVKTRDGFVMVTPISNKNFESLCTLMQRPDLLDDPRFVFGPRTRHFRELAIEIEQWSCKLDSSQCVELLNNAGVPCSAYVEPDELFEHPQVVARESFSKIHDDKLGNFLIQNMPMKFASFQNNTADWVAKLGEHTEEVMSSELGLSSAELQELRDQKVIS
jgi:CoA:oxalate CoA-transferase